MHLPEPNIPVLWHRHLWSNHARRRKGRRVKALSGAVAMVVLLAACGGSSGPDEDTIALRTEVAALQTALAQPVERPTLGPDRVVNVEVYCYAPATQTRGAVEYHTEADCKRYSRTATRIVTVRTANGGAYQVTVPFEQSVSIGQTWP